MDSDNEDDAALAAYLANQGFAPEFINDLGEMLVSFGGPDMSPALHEEAACAVCGTRVARFRVGGWKHLESYSEREGCETPWPGL